MSKEPISIEVFARRVERLCKHLRERMEPGSDRNAIEDLENDAADLLVNYEPPLGDALQGIAEVIK